MEGTLAERIRTRRAELGLNPVDLAAEVGVSVSAVLQWENGKTQNLKNEYLFAVADALNVSPRWLATGRGQKVTAARGEAYTVALSRRDEAASERQRKTWERIAAVFARAALVVLISVPPYLADIASSLRIMSNRLRRVLTPPYHFVYF